MNNVVDIKGKSERMDIAALWIARMDRGLSDAEQADLEDWMAQDSRNRQRLLSMAGRWDRMEDLSRLAELFPEDATERSQRRISSFGLAAAASIVIAIMAGLLWTSAPGPTETPRSQAIAETSNVYETAIGSQSTVTLSDGSIVVLNTNSRMRVNYTDESRVLHLERGEIHVEVSDDAERPFTVIAMDRLVQALGTSFSVEITDKQTIELMVTEGKVVVGVHSSENAAGISPPLLAQSSANTVQAGQETLLGAPEESVQSISAEEIEVKLSWKTGRLIFRGEPLEVALAEVERYTTVDFVFLDDNIRTLEVTGRFRTGDVESLLIALETNFNVSHERSDDGQILLSNL